MIDKIKHKIILRLKKTLHYAGYNLERIPNANHLYNELSKQHAAVQRHELKKFSEKAKVANNHTLYDNILKKYVPEWDNSYTSPLFIGSGQGEFNINVYRKMSYNNSLHFEKIYFTNSYSLMRMEWFYKHIYPIVKDELKTSKLYKITRGKVISIANFEYLDLKYYHKHEWESAFYEVSKKLIHLSKHTRELCKQAPDFLKDYTLHDDYKKNIKVTKKTIKELTENRLSSKKINEVIKTGPLVFSHGDIYDMNVFSGNYFIDWDSFGFFPLGFETAAILILTKQSPCFTDLEETVIKEYKNIVNADLWDSFMLNCWYFYLVFMVIQPNNESYRNLQKSIMSKIEVLYNKIIISNSKQSKLI